LRGEIAHIDHFIPWSRFPVDLGNNFVLALATCNGKKSDRLRQTVWMPGLNARSETPLLRKLAEV
jgi:5-methylcytosine-specific restriction endonuclease McrA